MFFARGNVRHVTVTLVSPYRLIFFILCASYVAKRKILINIRSRDENFFFGLSKRRFVIGLKKKKKTKTIIILIITLRRLERVNKALCVPEIRQACPPFISGGEREPIGWIDERHQLETIASRAAPKKSAPRSSLIYVRFPLSTRALRVRPNNRAYRFSRLIRSLRVVLLVGLRHPPRPKVVFGRASPRSIRSDSI